MRISVESQGGDRLVARIRGHEVVFDQPVEADGGHDTGPTPTELFVASLAACVAYYAEIYLRRHGAPADELQVSCDFEMSTDFPQRIARIACEIPIPLGMEASREALERVVNHCVLANSLHQPPAIDINLKVVQPA